MKAGLRQSMAWLHTWCGLVCAWLLCLIFLAGTLSVFRAPISHWMSAEPALPGDVRDIGGPAVLAAAGQWLDGEGAAARFWRIELPSADNRAMRVFWRDAAGVTREAALDPRNGAMLPQPWGRKTEGGRHFMVLHYTLYGGNFGFWLVGWLSVGMLVALLSGVIVHKRIFKDFFTFRRGKGQRSWLDAHNACGVLTLPFLFMICYTGLAFFYTSYMPWPLQAVYGADDGAYRRYQAELKPAPPAPASAGTGQDAGLALRALVSRARMLTGQEADRIAIERPGAAGGIVRVSGRRETGAAPRLLTHASLVVFDARSGAVLQAVPAFEPGLAAHQVHEAIETLHKADFGGWSMKWLYFVSGLAGTAMVATGTLLFAIKRRKKSEHEFGAATARVYLWVEAMNVAALAGIALASIVYLYANRLIPAALAGRESWEIRAFFLAWAASLAHAAWRGPRRAWIGQLALAALLCLGLPLLNRATTGQHLWAYAERGLMQQALLELTVLGLGLVLGYAAWAVRRGGGHAAPAPANARRPAAGPNPPSAAHRWQVGSRVLAASVGGYGVSARALSWLALALPTAGVPPAVAVLAATLASFVLYPLIVLGVFSARSAGRAWGALALVGALCTALLLGWRA